MSLTNNGIQSEWHGAVPFGRVSGLFGVPIEFSGIMDELALGIAIMDLSRRILFINSRFEALTGFMRDDVRACRAVTC